MESKIIRLASLLNWPLFLLVTFLLFRLSHLDFFYDSYSDLGIIPFYGSLFNFSLTAVGITQSLVLISIFKSKSLSWYGTVGLILLILASFTAIILGFVTKTFNYPLHIGIAVFGFSCSFIGWYFFGLCFKNVCRLKRFFFPFWGFVTVFLLLSNIYLTGTVFAIQEFLLFLGAFFTNFVLFSSPPILRSSSAVSKFVSDIG